MHKLIFIFGDGVTGVPQTGLYLSTRLSYLLSSRLPQYWANRYEPPHPGRIYILINDVQLFTILCGSR